MHGLHQTAAAYDAEDAVLSRTRVNMLGAHAVYDNNGWELIAEAYRLRNHDLAGGDRHASQLGYVHVGHSIRERWLPYVRWEKASLNQADNYFAALANGRSYTRSVLGMRYNLDPRAALKVEFNRTDDQGIGHSVDEWRLQYAVGF